MSVQKAQPYRGFFGGQNGDKYIQCSETLKRIKKSDHMSAEGPIEFNKAR